MLALPKQPRGSSRLNNLLAIVAGPRALGRRGPAPSAANYLSYLCMALRHPSTNQKSIGPLGSVVQMHISTVLNIRREHSSTVYPYSSELAYTYSVPPHSAPSAHAFVLTDTYRDFISINACAVERKFQIETNPPFCCRQIKFPISIFVFGD